MTIQTESKARAGALTLGIVLVFLLQPLSGQRLPQAPNWDRWQFLLGEWTAEGSGGPGQGTGSFSFSFDLQKQILVRRNHADYAGTKERAAYSHDDLMVIYGELQEPTHAIYFDNEGHVIHYIARFSTDQNTVTFLSDPVLSAPRFRLTYSKAPKETVTIKFEIAPPGKPEEFSTYVEGVAHRKRNN